jgi:hypothetical protein
MKKHSDIGGKEGENLTRQDFAADIIYHVIALGGANDPMGTQKRLKSPPKKMGRRSKATLSRVNNLGHAQKNLRAQAEDITDLQDPDFDENPPTKSCK